MSTPPRPEFATLEVTAFGETRTVRVSVKRNDDGTVRRLAGQDVDSTLVGRFPTGSKLHTAQMVLHPLTSDWPARFNAPTATTFEGQPFFVGLTLYRLNRNRGRLFGWYDAAQHAANLAR